MTIPAEAIAAALRMVFDKGQPWEAVAETVKYQHSGKHFTFTHYHRRANVKALVVRLVKGWGRVFVALSIDPEKADSGDEIGPELVQLVVTILAQKMRPRPTQFVVLSLTGDSARDICWE